MSAVEKIKLSEVPRRLRDEFGVAVSYRRVYTAVLDGTVPAERDASGSRWIVDADDLPEIAETLGRKPISHRRGLREHATKAEG